MINQKQDNVSWDFASFKKSLLALYSEIKQHGEPLRQQTQSQIYRLARQQEWRDFFT